MRAVIIFEAKVSAVDKNIIQLLKIINFLVLLSECPISAFETLSSGCDSSLKAGNSSRSYKKLDNY